MTLREQNLINAVLAFYREDKKQPFVLCQCGLVERPAFQEMLEAAARLEEQDKPAA
jgi:hypothetical protein